MPCGSLDPAVLAIDLGTSSVRTALFDIRAQRLPGSSASQVYRVQHTVEHGAELDPAVLLRATRKCLRQTLNLTNDSPAAIGGSGFWHSLLGLDPSGEPLTPVYTWADARCAEDAARLRTEFDEHEIQQRTGCMLRAAFWPAKLRWLRRTQSKLFRRVTRWVSPAEWIFQKIWGIRACSHSMASGTGLYNLARRAWDEELLAAVRLTRAQLGSLHDAVDCDRPIVFPAIGDGAAGNLGSGASSPGVVAINVGTSAAVRAILATEAPLPFGLFRFVVDQKRFLLGGAASNAGNLHAWCRRELRVPNDERTLEKILRHSTPGAARLTVLPFWTSERAPSWPENLDGDILGLTQASSAADVLRATTSAVSYRLADILELLEGAIGRAKRIIVSGGILRSPASLRILADALGRNLEICTDQEASLRGAVVHALEMSGEKLPQPKHGKIVRQDPANAAAAREARARQNQLEHLLCSPGLMTPAGLTKPRGANGRTRRQKRRPGSPNPATTRAPTLSASS
jgi:gluconokinase